MATPSSPLSSLPQTQSFTRSSSNIGISQKYKTVKELPFELAQHVQNYYEENLFTQAYSLLLSITSNSFSSTNTTLPVIIPPPQHLALAATISVLPSLTTRTTLREKREQANAALRLLRLVLEIAGPVNGKFSQAFKFTKFTQKSLNSRGRWITGDDSSNGRGSNAIDEDDLNTPYADSEGIWSRADDFWHVVGWVFNCSCLGDLYSSRWSQWKVWLEFVVDLLENDWDVRFSTDSIDESMIWQFVELAFGGHGRGRRLLRAVFTDGSSKSLSEFSQIFRHELKSPPQESNNMKKREVDVNIDAEVYGDYMRQDSDGSASSSPSEAEYDHTNTRSSKRIRTRTPSTRRLTPKSSRGSLRNEQNQNKPIPSGSDGLGGPQSIYLRLRLLNLLSRVSAEPSLTATSPTTFPDWTEFHTLMTEFIKPLPLPVFQQILTSSHIHLDSDIFFAMHQSLLYSLFESSAPDSSTRVVSRSSLENIPTLRKFMEDYMPFAANKSTADSNARVSLILESLWRGIRVKGHQGGDIDSSDVLDITESTDAVEKGIQRRMTKVKESDRYDGDGNDEEENDSNEEEEESIHEVDSNGKETTAWKWLLESGERLQWMIQKG